MNVILMFCFWAYVAHCASSTAKLWIERNHEREMRKIDDQESQRIGQLEAETTSRRHLEEMERLALETEVLNAKTKLQKELNFEKSISASE